MSTAALVLGVFQEAAYDEPDLLAVVARIERSLARNLGTDDFVTAVVAGYPQAGHLEVVNCGHAPPLLVRASGGVVPVDPTHPAPPLGLSALTGETPSLQVLPFADGDQLLLYTDGVTEARNHRREFYPLAEGLARHLCDSRRALSPPCTTNCWRTWAADCTTTRHCSCSTSRRLSTRRLPIRRSKTRRFRTGRSKTRQSPRWPFPT